MSVLEDRYNYVSTTPGSDIWEHLPYFVQTVEELQATRVIELGVRYGFSTLAWLYALRSTGFLWSVDVWRPEPDPNFPSVGGLFDPELQNEIADYWDFFLGDCHDFEVQAYLPDEVDVLFIDTNHVYEETLLELDMYLPKVRQGGRILLHDTAIKSTPNAGDRPQPPYPVLTAVQEFCWANELLYENRTNCYGLGTIYV